MKAPVSALVAVLLASPLISGCATWYSQTPVGIRHTRMMVDSHQSYSYYVDPVERTPYETYTYRETPLEWLSRVFSRSDR